MAVLEHPAAATAQRQRQKEEAEPEPLRPHERQSQKVMAKKKAVAAAASSEEAERIPSKKEIADGKRYAELEATASKNKLKQMTCFGFAKGRCKKGDDCPFLHVGAPNKLANAGKRKRVAAREEQGAKRKAAPKQKTWLCPKCGNKNWMRREVCNGHACQDQFRPSELKSGGTDPGRAETTTPHAAVVAGGVTTGGGVATGGGFGCGESRPPPVSSRPVKPRRLPLGSTPVASAALLDACIRRGVRRGSERGPEGVGEGFGGV